MNLIQNKDDIMVTGTGGLLGARVAELAGKHGYSVLRHFHHRADTELSESDFFGDLGDADHVAELAESISPGIIINCAALADVDRCERQPELSLRTNVTAIENLLHHLPRAKLVQISTDYVFPGIKAQPGTDERPEPINVYGKHKLEAEAVALGVSPDNLVIRTVLMFDNVDKRNFFRFVYQSLQQEKTVKGITDQYTNPVSATGAAEMILSLVAKNASGIWHIGGADYLNRFEFATRIAEYFSLNKDVIIPVTSETISRRADRPRLAGLDIGQTQQFLSMSAPRLEEEFERLK